MLLRVVHRPRSHARQNILSHRQRVVALDRRFHAFSWFFRMVRRKDRVGTRQMVRLQVEPVQQGL